MRPNVTSTIAKAVRNSLVWRHGVGRCFCWSSAEEAQCMGLRQPWLRRAVLPKCRGVWLSVKRLGNQCQCCAIYCRWFCAYAEDRDRKRSLTPLSPEKGLHVCCSQVGTLSKTNNLPLWISGIFQIIVFMLSTSRLFFCLLSRSSEMPSRLKTFGFRSLVWAGPMLVFLGKVSKRWDWGTFDWEGRLHHNAVWWDLEQAGQAAIVWVCHPL